MTTTQISLTGSSIVNFGDLYANNILCLNGNSLNGNAINVHGFGVSPGETRYNTKSSGTHGFYTNGVLRVSLGATSTFAGTTVFTGATNLNAATTNLNGNVFILGSISTSSNTVMRMGIGYRNNILCLYGNSLDPDSTAVHGFGAGPGETIYNTSGSGIHGFYTNGVQRVSLGATSTFSGTTVFTGATNLNAATTNVNGNVIIAGSISTSSNTVMRLGFGYGQNIVCLYGNSLDRASTNIHGFGAGPGETIYNTTGSGTHGFYTNGILRVSLAASSVFFGRVDIFATGAGLYVEGTSNFTGAATFDNATTVNAPTSLQSTLYVAGSISTSSTTIMRMGNAYAPNRVCLWGNSLDPYNMNFHGFGAALNETIYNTTNSGVHSFYTNGVYRVSLGATSAFLGRVSIFSSGEGLYVEGTSNFTGATTFDNATTVNAPTSLQSTLYVAGSISTSSTTVMRMGNGYRKNILCLYGNSLNPDSTAVYGFGVEEGLMRYNLGAPGTHDFYSGGSAFPSASLGATAVFNVSNTGFAGTLVTLQAARAATTAYNFIVMKANNVNQFRVGGSGTTYGNGAFMTSGADYAECFEWEDGNPDAQDRVGLSVVLVYDPQGVAKIREAQPGQEPIGVTSSRPSVVGDAAWNHWHAKYLMDDFGRELTEDVEMWTWDGGSCMPDDVPPDMPETATLCTVQRRLENPAVDESREYVPREDRAEWASVGLMGKLRLREGQQIGQRWIKTKQVSQVVSEYLVR